MPAKRKTVDHETFRQRYEAERPLYDRWGAFVTSYVVDALSDKVGSREAAAQFFKVTPHHRTKAVDSIIEKAYYRGKNYADPYAQITDKVGTRFVVLLLEDVGSVRQIVEQCPKWSASLDRDFETERLDHPTLFEYQSVHIVVRPIHGTEGNEYPPEMACEVQIRTLMQHAFSELTHDTLYKSELIASPKVRREVAKSMALIETTDNLFSGVSMTLREASSTSDEWVRGLSALFKEVVARDPEPNPRANLYLLTKLREIDSAVTMADVAAFTREEHVGKWVNSKADEQFLFRQPAILLAYYLARRKRLVLKRHWPFTPDELEPLFSDLGISLGPD